MTEQLTEYTKFDSITTSAPIIDYEGEFDFATGKFPTVGESRFQGIMWTVSPSSRSGSDHIEVLRVTKRIPGDNDADYDDSDFDPIQLSITDGDEGDAHSRRSITLTENQALDLAKALVEAIDPEARIQKQDATEEPR